MGKLKWWFLALLPLILLFGMGTSGCESQQAQSVSGTKMVKVGKVKTGTDGKTVEQHAISKRIDEDNQPGSIKHLYVISAYSGQVIIYSTVRSKVTSSHKRLTPSKVTSMDNNVENGFSFDVGGTNHSTDEIVGEDGTYGDSAEYIYWWDTKGVYHQHYISGGQILHISNQPLVVKGIIINMELSKTSE